MNAAGMTTRIRYPNGDAYVGQVDEAGVPHGQGTYNWVDGSRYVGMWAFGFKEGFGVYEDMRGTYTVGSGGEVRNVGLELRGQLRLMGEIISMKGVFGEISDMGLGRRMARSRSSIVMERGMTNVLSCSPGMVLGLKFIGIQ
jgi:MORN repeat